MKFRTLVLSLFCSPFALAAEEDAPPAIIPTPKEISFLKGEVHLSSESRILFKGEQGRQVAEVLSEDFQRLFGIKVAPAAGGASDGKDGDVILKLDESLEIPPEGYQLKAGGGTGLVQIVSADLGGLHAGSATLLQTFEKAEGDVVMPGMMIKDHPSKALRAHMFDMKNQWHSLAHCKEFVDMCRFYKVNYLSLHSGEDQWIGALTNQVAKLSPEERQKHRLYTKDEMDELVAYASKRGVYLLPHNECTPGFQHMKNAMQKDYVPGDEFAGFPDELDGKGSYEDYSGKAEDRWLNLMEICIEKGIAQFAAGHPDGKLPYYHVGPILGEGGMPPQLGEKILKMILKVSPDTQMMFWNGINSKDPSLYPHRENCVVAYYDDEFGASDMESYLREGWPVVNAAWSPLYVVGARLARPVERVYEDWNLMRQGSDGIPGGYGAVQWEQVSDEKYLPQILGGMLATWETPQKVHLERVRIRVPAMNERIWNHKAWSESDDTFPAFEAKLLATNRKLSAYLQQEAAAPSAPVYVVATEGTAKGKVRLEWRSGGGIAPIGYRVFRSTGTDLLEAKQIGSDLAVTVESFEDSEVEKMVNYNYWIVAFNDAGVSSASERVAGSAGDGVANIKSYEPFDYQSMEELLAAKEEPGWAGSWEARCKDEVFHFESTGLSYPGLETSGGAIRFKMMEDKNSFYLRRPISGQMGLDETEMWVSYLVKPSKVGVGDFFVVPNEIAGALGKVWGSHFSIYMSKSKAEMKAGKTYLVVARIDFGNGDHISLWVNPSLEKEPQVEDAAIRMTAELGTGNRLQVQGQGHGLGEYTFDELRLGSSWRSVGGMGSSSDKTKPNPDPMTWIGPPSVMEDGSVFMMCVDAEDESGVEYYFECVAGEGKDSGWQEGSSYRIEGLAPGTYSYRVKARDLSAHYNETEWSFAGEVEVK